MDGWDGANVSVFAGDKIKKPRPRFHAQTNGIRDCPFQASHFTEVKSPLLRKGTLKRMALASPIWGLAPVAGVECRRLI